MTNVATAPEEGTLRGADKREAFHREAESRIQKYSFKRPADKPDDRRGHFWLCKSDLVRAIVQMIPTGGDIQLHYHPGLDGFWMVLQGKARFYGPDEVIIGEFGPQEGLLMPRNARYWFENANDDEELHILLVTGSSGHTGNRIVDIGERPPGGLRAIRYHYPEDPKTFGTPHKIS